MKVKNIGISLTVMEGGINLIVLQKELDMFP